MKLPETIKIVVADDHAFFREGLIAFLNNERGMEVIGEAVNGEQLVRAVQQLKPDVVITDVKMPGLDGVEAIREMEAAGCTARCIVFSSFDYEYLVVEAIEAGAKGYIVKDVEKKELMEAIRMVYNDKYYYSSAVSARIVNSLSYGSRDMHMAAEAGLLNKKEREIVRLVCREETSEEIGKKLFMSKKNVDFLRAKIMKKLNVKTMIGLVIYAVKNKIFINED